KRPARSSDPPEHGQNPDVLCPQAARRVAQGRRRGQPGGLKPDRPLRETNETVDDIIPKNTSSRTAFIEFASSSSLDLQRPGRDAPLRVALYLGGWVFAAIAIQCPWTPTPDPSPQGGGEKKSSRQTFLAQCSSNSAAIVREVRATARRAPLPLAGRGRGWGCRKRSINDETRHSAIHKTRTIPAAYLPGGPECLPSRKRRDLMVSVIWQTMIHTRVAPTGEHHMTKFRHLIVTAVAAAGLMLSVSHSFAQQPVDRGDQPGLIPDDSLQLDPEFRKQMVLYRTNEPPGTIIISTAERHLYL